MESSGPRRTVARLGELPNRAKVLAAGAFTLAGKVWMPGVERMLENLWQRLTDDEVT
jgi:hypothetical protein